MYDYDFCVVNNFTTDNSYVVYNQKLRIVHSLAFTHKALVHDIQNVYDYILAYV